MDLRGIGEGELRCSKYIVLNSQSINKIIFNFLDCSNSYDSLYVGFFFRLS